MMLCMDIHNNHNNNVAIQYAKLTNYILSVYNGPTLLAT